MIGNKYMSGKFRYVLLAMVVFLLATTGSIAGTFQISNLELTHQKDFTVLTILGTVGMQVSHQSVVAKDGKPNRIVIDCLNARHNLSIKKFDNLPQSVITGIRTAQYATQPEEVVRVVLDLKKETIYRVESNNGAVKVFVSDSEARPFELWRSSAVVPAVKQSTGDRQKTVQVSTKTTPQKKPVVVAKKLATPKSESNPITVAKVVLQDEVKDSYKKPIPLQFKSNFGPAKPVVKKQSPQLAKVQKASLPKETKISKPATSKNKSITVAQKESPVIKKATPKASLTPTVNPLPTLKSSPVVVAQKQVPVKARSEKAKVKSEPKAKPTKSVVAKSETKAKQSKPTVAKLDSPWKSKKNSKPKVNLAAQATKNALIFSSIKTVTNIPAPGVVPPGSSTPKKDVHKPTPNKVSKATPPPVKKSEPVVVASVEKSKLPSVRNKASKYRRDAAKNARMKRSHVVQFPQRLVIKYNTGAMRDPFETLIDTEKSAGGGIEVNRIPNIEVLSLVGIIDAPNRKSAALMEDHEGIGYILKPGDRVRNGYVAQVDKQAVYFHINEYGWTRTVAKYMEDDK